MSSTPAFHDPRLLGKTDMKVCPLGFGGAEIGFEKADLPTVRSIVDEALSGGLNLIDTAAMYLESEALLGEALAGRRAEVFLVTKCGHAGRAEDPAAWSLDALRADVERSLKALRTDYVDVLLLHSCSRAILEAGEAVNALQRFRDAGKCRYVGYSGDADRAACALDLRFMDVLQCSVNIADQQSIDLLLGRAVESGVGVIAKRPIANAAWKTGSLPANPYHHTYFHRLQQLDYPFLKQELASAVSTAMRFTLSQPAVATAIVGTRQPGRWTENLSMLQQGPLPETEIAAIRSRWAEVAQADWVGQI